MNTAVGRLLTPMPAREVLAFLRVLADETRLTVVRLLARSDLRAGELVAALQLPANAVSYHLKQLRALGLVHDQRSTADARDVYYHMDVARLEMLFTAAGDVLHPALRHVGSTGGSTGDQAVALAAADAAVQPDRPARPLRVLFLCTHNSARSQLAEAILRQMGGNQVEVFSAGSAPTALHPDTSTMLRELGLDPTAYTAKSLDGFVGATFDYIITVCDRLRESCPVFPGDPLRIHWSFLDPVAEADPSRRLRLFRTLVQELTTRIRYLLLLPHPATGERLTPR